VKLSGGSPLMRAALAHTLSAAGTTKEASQMLDELTQLARKSMLHPIFSLESTLDWEKMTVPLNT
jgi:hypothetical protein